MITARLSSNSSVSAASSTATPTSARLSTFGSADFVHGRIEVRAQMPAGEWGGWVGFWLLPSEQTWQGKASCARVDLAEVGCWHEPIHRGRLDPARHVLSWTRPTLGVS